jgi:hypothetical protein
MKEARATLTYGTVISMHAAAHCERRRRLRRLHESVLRVTCINLPQWLSEEVSTPGAQPLPAHFLTRLGQPYNGGLPQV